MDDEMRQAFAEAFAQLDRQFAELMTRMNDQHERLLNRLSALESEARARNIRLADLDKS
jgi:hypothetical protein